MRPTKGMRFRAIRDVPVHVQVTYRNPSSDGFRATLPRGEVVVVQADPPQEARAVYALPDRYESLEPTLVPAQELRSGAYQSYSLVLMLDQLDSDFEVLSGGAG